jgi:hypothetical protein
MRLGMRTRCARQEGGDRDDDDVMDHKDEDDEK